jgi:peptide/nickel transport system substrate-binding protein
VDLRKVATNEYFQKYINVGSFDLASFRNVDSTFPSLLFPVFTSKGGQNYGKVGTAEIDTLLAAAVGETDRPKAADLLNQADALIWREGHSVELFQTPQILAVRNGLANFGAYGLRGDHQYVDIGRTK